MSVNRRILEEKTNQELEKYIEVGNRYVSEANFYAYEILKSRGRKFTDEENERLSSLKNINDVKSNEKIIHPNYKKSADLIYLSGALGIINILLSEEPSDIVIKIIGAVFSLAFIFGLGYLISKGIEWLKYVLLAILILGILIFPFISNLENQPVIGIINIIQTVLQIWSVVLLFKIPKLTKS